MFTSALFDADQIPFIHSLPSSNPDLGGSLSALNADISWPLTSDLKLDLFSAAALSSMDPGMPNHVPSTTTTLPIDLLHPSDTLDPLMHLPSLMSPNSSTRSFTTNSNYGDDREEEEDEDEDEIQDDIFAPPTMRTARVVRRQWLQQQQQQQFQQLQHQCMTTKTSLGGMVDQFIPRATNAYAGLTNANPSFPCPAGIQQQQQQQHFEQKQGHSYGDVHPSEFSEIHVQQQSYHLEQYENQPSAEVVAPIQFAAFQQPPQFPCPPIDHDDYFSGVHSSTPSRSLEGSVPEMVFDVSPIAPMAGLEYHPSELAAAPAPAPAPVANNLLAPPPSLPLTISDGSAATAASSPMMDSLSWVSVSSPPSPSGRLHPPPPRKSGMQQRHHRSMSVVPSFPLDVNSLAGMLMLSSSNSSSQGVSSNATSELLGSSMLTTSTVTNGVATNKPKTKRTYRAKSSRSKQTPTSFVCQAPGCGKVFSRAYNLTSHMKTHSEERPFPCGICHLAFARRHDRERHSRLHTGQKPYVCAYCQSGFMRNDALHRHQRVCTPANPQPTTELLSLSSPATSMSESVVASVPVVSSATVASATTASTSSHSSQL